MRWILPVAAVFVVLGAWAGFRADGFEAKFETGLAVCFGCHILLCLRVLYRSEPGSGDRMMLPFAILGSALMLVTILPRLRKAPRASDLPSVLQ